MSRGKDVRDVFAILETEELGILLVNWLGPKNNRMSTSEETASRRPLFRHNSSDEIVERESRDAPIQDLGVSFRAQLHIGKLTNRLIAYACQSTFLSCLELAIPKEAFGKHQNEPVVSVSTQCID